MRVQALKTETAPMTSGPDGTAAAAGGAPREPASAPLAFPARDGSELVAALVAGDKKAWDAFVARFARVIYAAVHRRLTPAGKMDDVEDVAQEVFIKLCRDDFKLLKGYDRERAKLTTWLTVIATTTSIDHLRRNGRPQAALDDLPEALLAVEPVLPVKVKIPEGLLSGRQALVIEMLYRREMEVAEIAAALQIEPQTVRSTHHKALVKLRGHFQDEEG